MDFTSLNPPPRAAFAAEHTPKGIRIGFNGWRSHNIIDLASCDVLMPQIVAFLDHLRLGLEVASLASNLRYSADLS